MKEHVLLWQAVHALGIDLPISSYEMVGPDTIRLNLYGGKAVEYSAPSAADLEKRPAPPEQAALQAGKKSKELQGQKNTLAVRQPASARVAQKG